MSGRPLTFAAIGLDHRRIYHLVGELIAAGACSKAFTNGFRIVGRIRALAELRSVERALEKTGAFV